MTPEAKHCSSCRHTIAGAASDALCPQCLLNAALVSLDVPTEAILDHDSDRQKPASAATPSLEGTKIGRYQLLQELGEGGFGIVYLAQQCEPVKRRVALKVIKPGMDSREVIARFGAAAHFVGVSALPVQKCGSGGRNPRRDRLAGQRSRA